MFMCYKCGLCCRNINKVPELSEFDNGNGVCIYLRKDNLCDIYQARPDICNVEKMYYIYFKHVLSKSDYYNMNMQGCRKLRESNLKCL